MKFAVRQKFLYFFHATFFPSLYLLVDAFDGRTDWEAALIAHLVGRIMLGEMVLFGNRSDVDERRLVIAATAVVPAANCKVANKREKEREREMAMN